MILRTQSNFTLQSRGEACRASYEDGPKCGEAAEYHLCVGKIEGDKIMATAFYTCKKDARWGCGLVFSHAITDDCGATGTQAWYDMETGESGCRRV